MHLKWRTYQCKQHSSKLHPILASEYLELNNQYIEWDLGKSHVQSKNYFRAVYS